MKANEAPEKIYIFDYNDAMVTPIEGDTTYVREDAFIEKACEWLKNNWREYVNTDKDGVVCFGHLEKDFRNYMKGE